MPGIVALCASETYFERKRVKKKGLLSDRDETIGSDAINEKFHITRF